MKATNLKPASWFLIFSLLCTAFASGCTPAKSSDWNTAGITGNSAAGPDPNWKWPDKIPVVAAGTAGVTALVAWCSMLERDSGMAIMVVPEGNANKRFYLIKDGDMFIHEAGKSGVRNHAEAIGECAERQGGGFQARIVWVAGNSHSAVFVRGDSPINSLYDIKPGIRWSVWSTEPSILKVPKAILDWVQVPHDQVKWVISGSTEGAVRAVSEGRADIMWFFPTSEYVYEAAAAPFGIKFIDLNSKADPEGAARFRLSDPMYTFGVMGDTVVPEARGRWGTVGEKYYITREQTDPNLVYNVAKWLDNNYDKFKDRHRDLTDMTRQVLMQGLETTYVPAHTGLIWYLKEKGLWNDDFERRQKQNIKILQVYIDAYAEAIALADKKGIEVVPSNKAWIELWENFKKERRLPPIAMHQSLKVDAPWVAELGLK